MATLLELREQIVIDAGIMGNDEFKEARLNRMINLAQRFVQIQLNNLGFKKWETSAAIAAPSSKTYAGVSCKFTPLTSLTNISENPKNILQIEVEDSVNTLYGVAREVSPSKFQEQLANQYLAPSIKEAVFMRLSGNIYLYPAAIDTLTVHYYKTVTDLSADTDSTEIPLEFEEYIVEKVVNGIKKLLGNIVDPDAEIVNEIQNAYNKFLGQEKEIKVEPQLQ